jgi:hypothetical protein
MDKDSRERFERIEANLEQISVSHMELEAAQRNLTALLDRISHEWDERMKASDERWNQRFETLDERLNILIGIVDRHITDPDAHRREKS